MELFAQSSGRAQECGYEWVEWDGRQLRRPVSARFLQEFVVTDLYDSYSFSLVLARRVIEGQEPRLLLLVAGLLSSRHDFIPRPIRNTVAWVASADAEPALRALAAKALGEEGIGPMVDDAVADTPDGGFEVDFQCLLALASNAPPAEPPTVAPLRDTPQGAQLLVHNSLEMRNDLAKQLVRYQLPDGNRPLVVVTGNLDPERLRRARVWRGLVNQVNPPSGESLTAEKKTSNLLPRFRQMLLAPFRALLALFRRWGARRSLSPGGDPQT
jgi:hypothetical protein